MVDFTFSCNSWGGASFIVTTGFAAWEGLSWQEFHNLASVQMQLYEVLFKQSIREALLGAGIAEPEADNTEYLFLLGEFGGACFRTYSRMSKVVGQRSKHTKNATFQDPIILIPQQPLT
jgi:hypothetical protein